MSLPTILCDAGAQLFMIQAINIMLKTGLVLSGGGVRGFAHLGLLQALHEMGIRPSAVSGVSAGAIVGAFYAAGLEPKKIMEILKKNSFFGWSNFFLNRDGFFSMKALLSTMQAYIPRDSFESLGIPFFVTATDFSNNKSVTFSKGELYRTVLASSSVPVIFEPIKIGDDLFVDGGLLNNFPVEPLEKICNKLIGSHVNSMHTGVNTAKRIGKMNIIFFFKQFKAFLFTY